MIGETTHQNTRNGGRYHAAVKWWLLAGVVLVVGQIVIGGITRLTESGLSITEWKPLAGAVYPGSEADWQVEFDKYKASPQYEIIFADISMAEFKFIYFWEWFHRQWARMMGLIFAVGFAFFYWKGMLDKPLIRRLGIVVLLAALAASMGWIMVASGLVDRPWVNAYKLTLHLCVGLSLFSYLLWTNFKVWQPKLAGFPQHSLKTPLLVLLAVLILQIILGGIMSGAKYALSYPSWPDMNGVLIPGVLLESDNWIVDNFVDYDKNAFLPALIQFLHRMTAYALVIIGLYFSYLGLRKVKTGAFRNACYLLISLLVIQVTLGIATVINSIGEVPVDLGVAHQTGAIALLGAALYCSYLLWPGQNLRNVEKTVEKTENEITPAL